MREAPIRMGIVAQFTVTHPELNIRVYSDSKDVVTELMHLGWTVPDQSVRHRYLFSPIPTEQLVCFKPFNVIKHRNNNLLFNRYDSHHTFLLAFLPPKMRCPGELAEFFRSEEHYRIPADTPYVPEWCQNGDRPIDVYNAVCELAQRIAHHTEYPVAEPEPIEEGLVKHEPDIFTNLLGLRKSVYSDYKEMLLQLENEWRKVGCWDKYKVPGHPFNEVVEFGLQRVVNKALAENTDVSPEILFKFLTLHKAMEENKSVYLTRNWRGLGFVIGEPSRQTQYTHFPVLNLLETLDSLKPTGAKGKALLAEYGTPYPTCE